MTVSNGFIKLHRKILQWGWFHDHNTLVVFIYLLLMANFEEHEYRGITLKPGQLVTGRKRLAKELGLGEQAVRTALNHLKSTNEITIKTTNRFTVVTVVNWEKYQSCDDVTNQQTNQEANQQLTNNQPTTNQQLTTYKNEKKNKKEKKEKNIYTQSESYGEFSNVILSDDEYTKLVERFPMDYQERIESLSEYIKQTGRKYNSHYATILAWDRRDKKKQAEQKKEAEGRMDWLDELERVHEVREADEVDLDEAGFPW